MDGIYNWILSVPEFVMNTKFISCGYTASSEAFNLSGELYGGPFLLIGFRSGIYASITAHSYWKDRAISVATIENGIWAKRFEKLITNNDLQGKSEIYAPYFNGNSYPTLALAVQACVDSLPNERYIIYFRTIEKGSLYKAIIQKYDNENYASAIVFSYDYDNPLTIYCKNGTWQTPKKL